MKKVAGVSREELADRLQISVTTVRKYRDGYIPPIETVMAICIVLNLKTAYSIHLLKSCNYSLEDNLIGRAYMACLEWSDGSIEHCNIILDRYGVDHFFENKKRKKLLMNR